ncbi:hypothetical protein [Paenibacillus soyae]|uniref:Uncharacterized protein n=1 Tax=Paenibacillus soyae TaxID=2969249 RepID=A0A9X2MVL0_9BACL|nr:hypothetical protein [Paenibacillus soyae]MCR2807729.1 hypothetical protein [Paenibacillus soyae]
MENSISKNSTIAFLDILGFRQMIQSQSHERMMRIYDMKISRNMDAINKIREVNPNLNYSNINYLNLSDSIILWVDGNDALSMFFLITSVRDLMVSFLKNGMPLRGGIATGQLAVRNNNAGHMNVIGLGLTKAYELEENQQWSGCIISNQCIEILKEDIEWFNALIDFKFIVEYEVPKKSGTVDKNFVINWCNADELKNYHKGHLRDRFQDHGKPINNWAARVKYDNTLSFFKAHKPKKNL